MVLSQGSGSGFAYDYTRQYTHMIIGVKDYRNQYSENQLTYVLPEDSFVSSTDSFLINGGQCSRYWVNTETSIGGGNHYTSRTTETYINFAFCKKGDVITSTDGHAKYPLGGNTFTFSGVNLTIIPARK